MSSIVAWVTVLVASIVGLSLRDVRLYGVTLAVSLVILLLLVLARGGVLHGAAFP